MEKGLSKQKQFTQDDIPMLLDKVNGQIKELKVGIPESTKTTGILDGFGTIANIATVANLLKAHSMIVAKSEAYDKSAKDILPKGVKKPALTINGSSPSAWIADIKGRIIIVGRKAELDKLIKVKTKLESNLSAKAKLAKDLNDCFTILED